jgi:adenine/guanine/hypoxanthine permease
LKAAALYLAISAGFTFFGIIHSAVPDGNIYLPWSLGEPFRQIPYQFTAGYAVLALLIFLLSFTQESRARIPEGA